MDIAVCEFALFGGLALVGVARFTKADLGLTWVLYES